MIDAVKEGAEISLHDVADVCSISCMIAVQVRQHALPCKTYALAFDGCRVVINQSGQDTGKQNILAERMAKHSVLD